MIRIGRTQMKRFLLTSLISARLTTRGIFILAPMDTCTFRWEMRGRSLRTEEPSRRPSMAGFSEEFLESMWISGPEICHLLPIRRWWATIRFRRTIRLLARRLFSGLPSIPAGCGRSFLQSGCAIHGDSQLIRKRETFWLEMWDWVGRRRLIWLRPGVAVASGENWRFATAEFDKVQTLSVSLQLNDPAPNTPLPRDLVLQADVQTNGVAVSRVDFVAGGQVIASVGAPPWRFVWTNAWSGDYDAAAIAVDQNGFSMISAPQRLSLISDPPVAGFAGSTAV